MVSVEKAMFRLSDICKYSNKTLSYIKESMNMKQEQLMFKGRAKPDLRRQNEEIIDEQIEARNIYKALYRECNKPIPQKKRLKIGDLCHMA
ncbi:hypothetical protein Hdeb2414_s0216g00836501 [Helianthus debilis subsp. tardiflorus]